MRKLSPDAIPVHSPVADVGPGIALHQTRFGSVTLFVRMDHLEIGDRLLEMHGIVADHEPQIANGGAPVIGLVVVLPVKAKQHVASIPDGHPLVHLLAAMGFEVG